MALVKCPECGRENVSSSAVACPNCGYPIKDHFSNSCLESANTAPMPEGRVSYYATNKVEKEVIFDNGLKSGSKGKHNSANKLADYWVDGDQLYLSMPAGTVTYKITEEFLLSDRGKYKGFLREENNFHGICKNDIMQQTIVFEEDGSCKTTTDLFGESEVLLGRYRRNGSLLVIEYEKNNGTDGFIIFDHTLYCVSFLNKVKAIALQQLINPLSCHAPASVPTATSVPVQSSSIGTVKCPHCQSTAVRKLSTLGKLASIGMFGIASSKIGKQWHCYSCGSNF